MKPENSENPDLKPPAPEPLDAPLQPGAPDFVETPEVELAAGESEKLPVWLYLVCGFALFLVGSSFIGFQTFGLGLYDQGAGSPQIAEATNDKNSPASGASSDPVALGKKIYGGKCANCHQASGAGQPGSYPPLVASEWVLGNKEQLIAIMLNGVEGPLTVKGSPYGTQQMPGWSGALTDENIANLLTFLRASWGNSADAVKADEVSAARAKYNAKTGAWSEADLKKVGGK